jgi:hypothetical protein
VKHSCERFEYGEGQGFGWFQHQGDVPSEVSAEIKKQIEFRLVEA